MDWEDTAKVGDRIMRKEDNLVLEIFAKHGRYFWVGHGDFSPYTVLSPRLYSLIVPAFEVGKHYVHTRGEGLTVYEVVLQRGNSCLLSWTDRGGALCALWVKDRDIERYKEVDDS